MPACTTVAFRKTRYGFPVIRYMLLDISKFLYFPLQLLYKKSCQPIDGFERLSNRILSPVFSLSSDITPC